MMRLSERGRGAQCGGQRAASGSGVTVVGMRAYEYQLQQVEAQLAADPQNAALQRLVSKLRQLMELEHSVDRQQRERTAARPNVEARRGAEPSINLSPGEVCEARCDGKWFEATVTSVAPDKQSCTVVFADTAEALHCTSKDVRAHDSKRAKKRSLASPLPHTAPLCTRTPPAPRDAASSRKRKSDGTGGGGRAEYVEKKEQEHREKQQSWLQFSQKIAKSNPAVPPRTLPKRAGDK